MEAIPNPGRLGAAVTPDGRTIVSASNDRTLKVWDLATGICKATFEGHAGAVWGVAVTPDGQTLVSASADRTLKVWDLATGKCKATFEGHAGAVWGVAVTPDGQTLVSASDDRTLKVWDLATGICKATFEGHARRCLGSGCHARWPDDRLGFRRQDAEGLGFGNRHMQSHVRRPCRRCRGVAVTPDGQTIVSASDDRTLKVWDLATGKCRATFEGHATLSGAWPSRPMARRSSPLQPTGR